MVSYVRVGGLVRAGQQRGVAGQCGQEPAGHGVQLPDVAVGEGAQERSERGRGPYSGEQAAHRAVPQPVHVLDAVGARGHAAHQRHQLRGGEGAGAVLRARQVDELVGQSRQAAPFGQPHHRFQSAVRDQVRIIERG
jgi:hypothetical protein